MSDVSTYCGKPEPTRECEALGFCDYHAGTSDGSQADSCGPAAIEAWRWYVDARVEAVSGHLVESDR